MFDAINRRYVLGAGFVAAGRRGDISAVSSVGKPRGVRSPGDSYPVAQIARVDRFVVMCSKSVRLYASDPIRAAAARSGCEVHVVRRGRIRSTNEPAAQVHGIRPPSNCRIARPVSEVPAVRTGISIESDDCPGRNDVLDHFVPFVFRESLARIGTKGRKGCVCGGESCYRSEKERSRNNGIAVLAKIFL